MKELVTQSQAETVMRIIAVASPIVGVICGTIVGLVRRQLVRSAIFGCAIIGLVGNGIFVLWRMYTWFGWRYSYTSITSLAIQLAIFVGLGVAVGALARSLQRS